jgi:hypothetical protein
MPVNPTYPGVYIEEVPSGVRTIVGVSTSVAAFIGSFARGPLDQPIQIFSQGDFQREFGGLRADSETSYTVPQFFLNGGSEAWVVRTAPAAESEAPVVASVTLLDESEGDSLRAFAGRQIRDASVEDRGDWGNNLRIDIDYNTTDPGTEFNLTVTEVTTNNGRETVVNSETYRNLTVEEAAANYAVSVVNEASRLIQLERLADDINRPAATGSTTSASSDLSAALADGDDAVSSNDAFVINFPDTTTATATLNFDDPPPTLADLRRAVQAAIRSATPGDEKGDVRAERA